MIKIKDIDKFLERIDVKYDVIGNKILEYIKSKYKNKKKNNFLKGFLVSFFEIFKFSLV